MYLREKYRRPENAYPGTANATSGLRFLTGRAPFCSASQPNSSTAAPAEPVTAVIHQLEPGLTGNPRRATLDA